MSELSFHYKKWIFYWSKKNKSPECIYKGLIYAHYIHIWIELTYSRWKLITTVYFKLYYTLYRCSNGWLINSNLRYLQFSFFETRWNPAQAWELTLYKLYDTMLNMLNYIFVLFLHIVSPIVFFFKLRNLFFQIKI